MELRINDYVRTKSNGIQKIDEEGRINLGLIRLPFRIIKEEELLKSSPNIIDLIEVGDYVNGLKITLIHEPSMANYNKRLLYAEDEEGYLIKMFDKQDIKSIVTREQFSQMQYKVGE